MHIALFGAGGNIGQRIAKEALDRGHHVTAVVRQASSFTPTDSRLRIVDGDATDVRSVDSTVRGVDAVVSAISSRPSPRGLPPSSLTAAARALIAGLKAAGKKRLVVVGGAGSLEVAPGVLNMDQPSFPEAYKPEAAAQRDALAVYRAEAGDLDWTFVSPAAEISPGQRTGRYRTGGDQLLVDASGHSQISHEDYAVALVDELENARHLKRRITFAY
ncbi:MAG: NAD(P)-dependent oxidoreductase [Acidobacteriota bacterium]